MNGSQKKKTEKSIGLFVEIAILAGLCILRFCHDTFYYMTSLHKVCDIIINENTFRISFLSVAILDFVLYYATIIR